MSRKKVEFQELELTERQHIEKIKKDTAAALKYTVPTRKALENFYDLTANNQDMLKAHPKILVALANAVDQLAIKYLESEEFRDAGDEVKPRMHHNINKFREGIKRQVAALEPSEQLTAAGKFAEKAVEIKRSKAAQPAAAAMAENEAEVFTRESADNGKIIQLTINVSQGGNVFINNDGPANWVEMPPRKQSPSEIAAEGPKRRGSGPGKPR